MSEPVSTPPHSEDHDCFESANRQQPLAQPEVIHFSSSPSPEETTDPPQTPPVDHDHTTDQSRVVSDIARTSSGTVDTNSSSTTFRRSDASSPTSRSGTSDFVCETGTESTPPSSDSEVRMRQQGEDGSRCRALNRPMSFRLMSQHGPVLMDDMTIEGHSVSVSLGEEGVEWSFKKSGKKQVLKFEDIFAVNPLLRKCKQSPHQTSAGLLKTMKRKKQHNADNIPVLKPVGFSLHSLHPDKPGHVVGTDFLCSSGEMATTWLESIKTLMHECSLRPRRLFVVINPFSGKGHSLRTWDKVQELFELADVDLEVVVTKKKGHGRELTQYLDCNQFDGIVGVGGDGLCSELLNGLLIQAQFNAGVNLRRARFIPVQPTIRLGMIPTGSTNTLPHSMLNQPSPITAAVQIILGRSVQVDVCSVYSNGQLMAFSLCSMNYSISNVELLPKPDDVSMSWFEEKISSLSRKLSKKSFNATLMYVPSDNPISQSYACSSLCEYCSFGFQNVSSSDGLTLATASATFKEVDKADAHEWKTKSCTVHSVAVAPHVCASTKHPWGLSPGSHFGDGCLDIIIKRPTKISHALAGSNSLSNVEIIKAKEFKFVGFQRRSTKRSERGSSPYGTDHEDDDEKTNRIAGKKFSKSKGVPESLSPEKSNSSNSPANGQSVPSSSVVNGNESQRSTSESLPDVTPPPVDLPPGCWMLDGDITSLSDVDVRVHKQLVQVFGYKPPPDDQELMDPKEWVFIADSENQETSLVDVGGVSTTEQENTANGIPHASNSTAV